MSATCSDLPCNKSPVSQHVVELIDSVCFSHIEQPMTIGAHPLSMATRILATYELSGGATGITEGEIMKIFWRIARVSGITLLTGAVLLILIAEYRSYADKVEQNNLDTSRRTLQTDTTRHI